MRSALTIPHPTSAITTAGPTLTLRAPLVRRDVMNVPPEDPPPGWEPHPIRVQGFTLNLWESVQLIWSPRLDTWRTPALGRVKMRLRGLHAQPVRGYDGEPADVALH